MLLCLFREIGYLLPLHPVASQGRWVIKSGTNYCQIHQISLSFVLHLVYSFCWRCSLSIDAMFRHCCSLDSLNFLAVDILSFENHLNFHIYMMPVHHNSTSCPVMADIVIPIFVLSPRQRKTETILNPGSNQGSASVCIYNQFKVSWWIVTPPCQSSVLPAQVRYGSWVHTVHILSQVSL